MGSAAKIPKSKTSRHEGSAGLWESTMGKSYHRINARARAFFL
jgi:hypothetical protein